MDDDELLQVLHSVADTVGETLHALSDWGLAGTRAGQYRTDLAADEAALPLLHDAGLAVLSEESGATGEGDLLAVLDPVDGSTNASRGVPWYATSICVLDDVGPRVALVANQATGVRYTAIRGRGARCGERPLAPKRTEALSQSLVALSGYPRRHMGWRQYRALGAAALDLCAVADGVVDAYVDCSRNAHGPWDYLGGALVCTEAGVSVADAFGRDLVAREHGERRTPLAAATPQLLDELIAARRALE